MPPAQKTITIHRLTKEQLHTELHRLPGYVSGRYPDVHGLGRSFKHILAFHLFSKIHSAFQKKSDGQADDVGDKWKPLSKATIANRPLQPGEAKKLGILGLGRGGIGLLTMTQAMVWKGIFKSNFLRLAPRIGEEAAKIQAAKIAWGILKSQGAKTKLEILGNRKVPILHVTGRLENSITPGRLVNDQYDPPTEQLFLSQRGSITIGSKVPYAKYVHAKRPLWPTLKKMTPWIAFATKQALIGLTDRLTKTLSK